MEEEGRHPPTYQTFGAAAGIQVTGAVAVDITGENDRKKEGRYLGSGPGPGMIPETIINVSMNSREQV